MTQLERSLYFRACQPSQFIGASFRDHQYNDDEDPDEENAADVGGDYDDERQPS
jgi:hypothetical protein